MKPLGHATSFTPPVCDRCIIAALNGDSIIFFSRREFKISNILLEKRFCTAIKPHISSRQPHRKSSQSVAYSCALSLSLASATFYNALQGSSLCVQYVNVVWTSPNDQICDEKQKQQNVFLGNSSQQHCTMKLLHLNGRSRLTPRTWEECVLTFFF